jgi:tetrahydromethanopterin S-methyltransferase subunit F
MRDLKIALLGTRVRKNLGFIDKTCRLVKQVFQAGFSGFITGFFNTILLFSQKK